MMVTSVIQVRLGLCFEEESAMATSERNTANVVENIFILPSPMTLNRFRRHLDEGPLAARSQDLISVRTPRVAGSARPSEVTSAKFYISAAHSGSSSSSGRRSVRNGTGRIERRTFSQWHGCFRSTSDSQRT